jgi:SagB-type dehydrogenase family enzyme
VIERFLASNDILKDQKEREFFVAGKKGLRPGLNGNARISLDSGGFLQERAKRWHSSRHFAATPASLSQMQSLLSHLRGFESAGKTKYAYPSAGETHAVQTYLWVRPKAIEGLDAGIYYFHPERNELVRIASSDALSSETQAPANRALIERARFGIIFLADLGAIRPMYGKYSENFAWMEAGHMSQLLRQAAPDCGLGLCLIGFFELDGLRRPLALGAQHVSVGMMAGGVLAESTTVVSFAERAPIQAPAAEPPHSALTESIAAIWRDVLHVGEVGLRDNFFESGGTSFNMFAIQREVLERLKKTICITDLFRFPTVAALAEFLEEGASPRIAPHSASAPAETPLEELLAKRRLRRSIRADPGSLR